MHFPLAIGGFPLIVRGMTSLYPDPTETPMDWNRGGRVHNWQNHIGKNVRALWDTLSDDMKLVLAADAQDRADNEDWD